jgi:hypothetical protein
MNILVSSAILVAVLSAAQPAASQGIGHTFFMRGSIVDISAGNTVVCIGKADGAQVNQVLDVYRVKMRPGPQKTPDAGYRRELVGHVKIDHIFSDHFAHARVSSGSPALNDIVELQRRTNDRPKVALVAKPLPYQK